MKKSLIGSEPSGFFTTSSISRHTPCIKKGVGVGTGISVSLIIVGVGELIKTLSLLSFLKSIKQE